MLSYSKYFLLVGGSGKTVRNEHSNYSFLPIIIVYLPTGEVNDDLLFQRPDRVHREHEG